MACEERADKQNLLSNYSNKEKKINFIRLQVSENKILYLKHSSILLIAVTDSGCDIYLSVDNIYSGNPQITVEAKYVNQELKDLILETKTPIGLAPIK